MIPTIVTNKHVVCNNPSETMKFFLHLREGEGSSENFEITFTTNWIFHSDKDLCFCFVNPVFEYVKKVTGKDVFYSAIDDSVLTTNEKLEGLSALEELVMVGYPNGMWDERR